MELPVAQFGPLKPEETVNIVRMCKLFTAELDSIGTMFVTTFTKRQNISNVGSTLLLAFREFNSKHRICERIVLSYLLYRLTDIEYPIDRSKSKPEELIEHVLCHPYLAFFLVLMEGRPSLDGNNIIAEFDLHFPLPILAPSEKYFIACLLMGRVNDFANSRPVDIASYSPQQLEAINLSQYKEAVKYRQSSYSLMSKVYSPAILSSPEEVKSLDHNDSALSSKSLVELSYYSQAAYPLPPSFYRLPPDLMPPCEDEYELLHPLLVKPLWTDINLLDSKLDEAVPEKESKLDEESDANKNSLFNEDRSSISSSLPTKPLESSSLEQQSITRNESVSSLPNLNIVASSSEKCSRDVECSSLPDMDNTSSNKKPLLNRTEAIELLKKAQMSVIARTEAQKLADAISNDPSLINCVEIGLEKYQKFIDENPAVAAAVIVERIRQNKEDLPLFFDLLRGMNLTVQAMEVVNKLCMQTEFPQEYLDAYISACVERCTDPNHSAFTQCRQVRMVCVFISSLIRNRSWNVQPLSYELQGFVLKFSNVKEAASLYQAILMASQNVDEPSPNASEITTT